MFGILPEFFQLHRRQGPLALPGRVLTVLSQAELRLGSPAMTRNAFSNAHFIPIVGQFLAAIQAYYVSFIAHHRACCEPTVLPHGRHRESSSAMRTTKEGVHE